MPDSSLPAEKQHMDLSRGDEDTIRLQTTTIPVVVSPARTALIIIDMQNYFLHPVLRSHPTGLQAYDKLISTTIPSCQKAGIDIIFVNWGLTEFDLRDIPPMIHRSFSKDIVEGTMPQGKAPQAQPPPGTGTTVADTKLYIGLGEDLGDVEIPVPKLQAGDINPNESDRLVVHAGRVLMRGSWNAMLYGELELVWRQYREEPAEKGVYTSDREFVSGAAKKGRESKAFLVPKNRLSGMWGQYTPLEELLHTRGIKTLLFAGVNTDQCVSGTMGDAFSKGFDCVLVTDACGTGSPEYMTDAVIRNAERCWGFVSDSERLAEAVLGQSGE